MSREDSSVFVAALLYSNGQLRNSSEQSLLNRVRETIKNDNILSQTIHPVSIDNQHARDMLRHNSSGINIANWPVFVLKYPGQTPHVYPLSSANEVFKKTYESYNAIAVAQGHPKVNKSAPVVDTSDLSPSPSDLYKSNVGYNSSGYDMMICPTSLSGLPNDGKPLTCMVLWNDLKSSNVKTIYVHQGDSIRFKSTDKRAHDLVEATNDWKVASNPSIDFRKKGKVGFDETVKFPEDKVYYLMSSDKNMKLKVEVVSNDSYDHLVTWNLTDFPADGSGKELNVCPGDKIKFHSNDGLVHDITNSNMYWSHMLNTQLVPRKAGINELINVNNKVFNGKGPHYLICSVPGHDSRMRLKINVLDKNDYQNSYGLNGVNSNDIDKILLGVTGNYIDNESIKNNLPDIKEHKKKRKHVTRVDKYQSTNDVLDGMTHINYDEDKGTHVIEEKVDPVAKPQAKTYVQRKREKMSMDTEKSDVQVKAMSHDVNDILDGMIAFEDINEKAE